jgi:protein TonB
VTALHSDTPNPFVRLRASGWIVSLCLHGTAVFLAALFAAKIGLAPPSSSFHWDVRVINSSPATLPVVESPRLQAATSTPAQPAPRNIQTASTRPSSPRTSLPTAPTPLRSALPAERLPAAHPAMPPQRKELQQPFERSTSTPPHESQEAEQEPPLNATSKSKEPLPDSPSPPSDHSLTDAARRPGDGTSPSPETGATPPPMTSLAPLSPAIQAPRKLDYGWLTGPLLQRLETFKQYPATARLQRLEGRVVVRIVIREDGHIASAIIAKSSGHSVLDQAALETIRQASPIPLSQPLEKSFVTMHIPLGYSLDR